MNILAIADRKPSKSISRLITENNVDIICTLGDLEYFDIHELEDVKDIPKIGVYGNHCSGNYFEQLGIKNMHLQTFEYKGVIFGGFEGSLKYKESKYAKMYTQEEAVALMKDFPTVDVFLAHSPPFGINDEAGSTSHQGLIALKDYVENKKPKYFLHGHTYPTFENLVTKHEDTNIVYVFGDKIITI
ncbi:MAG: metallophosphoesterase [uncultured bacterium]|nr:MAG: metallophosphoesterase [uncultured bacterium]